MIGSPANAQNEIVKYLDEAQLMQVVTSSGDRPWVATVFFASDNRHYLYWLSPSAARHSRDIERNNQVCAAITVPHRYGEPQRGLQLEGLARRVPQEEIEAGFQSFGERYGAHHRLNGLLSGEDSSALYQIIPSTFALYDEIHFPTQPQQQWQLATGDAVPVSMPAAPAQDAPYNPMNDV